MNQPERIVITGGPGSGKSTLIEALAKAGFGVQEEAAREIIWQFQSKEINPWNKRSEFIKLVYERIIYELHQPVSGLFFCDRGTLDCIAYLREAGLTVPADLDHFNPHLYYSKEVFILPPWENIYCQDWARRQAFSQAVSLYHHIRSTYLEYGFQLVEVPMLPIKERIDFLLQHLKRKSIFEWEKT